MSPLHFGRLVIAGRDHEVVGMALPDVEADDVELMSVELFAEFLLAALR